jgi:putative peptidoglycan lipid II flippase
MSDTKSTITPSTAQTSVAKSSFIFAAGTLFSRISGVARESVVGAIFGASVYMDAFVVAFRIPNLLRELLAEGALGSSFTKVYSSLCVTDKNAASKLLVQTLQFVVMMSLCISVIGIYFAEPLVNLMTVAKATQSAGQFHDVAVALTQLLFPFIGFASLGAVVQGALYQRGGFFLAGVAPILFNLFSIAGALWFAPFAVAFVPQAMGVAFGGAGILGLAIGTLLGGAAQSGVQAWGIWKPLLSGKTLWPRTWPWSSDVRKVMVLMAPMVIAASAGQVNVIVNTNFATSLGTGAVTWLYFAFRLVQLPIGMFGVAVGAAVLPALSKSITEAHGKVDAKASGEVVNAMDLVAWLMIPCTMILTLCSTDITRLLYEAGRFTPADTNATATAIEAYSYGLLGYGLLKVLNSYYYATGRTKYPMGVSLFSIAGNYAANSMLVHRFGHQGLGITASIMLTMNSMMLMAGMAKDGLLVPWKQVITSCALLLIGSCIAIFIHGLYAPTLSNWSLIPLLGIDISTSSAVFLRKIDSAIRIAIDTIFIVTLFGGAGLARIGKTPKEAMRMLKRR